MANATCSVDGCEKPSRVRSMCSMHYERVRRLGDASDSALSHLLTPTLESRLTPRLDMTGGPDSCWEWQGNRLGDGYGTFSFQHQMWRAHRASYVVNVGPIPDGMFVCHRCDNPPCCNPTHLFLGSPKDNHSDMFRKKRHPLAGRLSEAQVASLKVRIDAGEPIQALADEFGVHYTTIWRRVSGRRTGAGS